MKNSQPKKPGNGFRFKIAQAVIYTIVALTYFILSFTMLGKIEKSYLDYLTDREDYVSLKLPVGDQTRSGRFYLKEGEDRNGTLYAYVTLNQVDYYFDFVSENTVDETMTFVSRDTGEEIVLLYSDIGGSLYNNFNLNNEEYTFSCKMFAVLGGVFAVWALLQYVVSFVGKKSIAAENLGIVINALTLFLGTFGLVGSVKGRMTLQYAALAESEKLAATAAEASVPVGEAEEGEKPLGASAKESALSDGAATEENAVLADEAEAVPRKKGRKGVMIALVVSYALLLLAGILLAAVPSFSSVVSRIGICKQENARAYGISIGVMWIALVPTVGYYFAAASPYSFGRKAKTLIAAVSSILLVAMNVVYFVVIGGVRLPVDIEEGGALAVKTFFEGSDRWFLPATTVFASLGIALFYASFLFEVKTGDGAQGGNAAAKITKKALGAKENHPDAFVLAVTILMTWLAHFVAFIVAVIVIALFIGIVAMFFLGVCRLGADDRTKKAYTFVNDMGCEQTVYSSDGRTFYSANGEYVGTSDDDGKTIHS